MYVRLLPFVVLLWLAGGTLGFAQTAAHEDYPKTVVALRCTLREAKLSMLTSSQARFRHSFAWGPSIIFGDGDRVP